MRSLKECYEIAKRHHSYWTGNPYDSKFMCLAASKACDFNDLTLEEYSSVTKDAMSLVKSLDDGEYSLRGALGNPSDEEVKAYWDKYIDNMENQDG